MRIPNVPMFECEWLCICNSRVYWIGAAAKIMSQTGAIATCLQCDTVWRITPKGVTQVTE